MNTKMFKDYNTQRSKMKLPEYGRALHKMVEHALTIEDRDERNLAVKSIIDIMGMMYPYLRDINDFKHKLWDHIAIMSDFKLDIDYPYDPPVPETFTERPRHIPYDQSDIKYRHYGKIVEQLIDKISKMEEGSATKALNTEQLANQMKKSYLTWNKDMVEDEKILDDLKIMSKGRLPVREDLKLQEVTDIIKIQKKKTKQGTPGPNRKHK
ncbi:MAG: DUF4290 domain-containing protein [Marinilabiliales bacterium]|nr:DUF4290 domain-containing protein [Marinilabiliales bacterium]